MSERKVFCEECRDDSAFNVVEKQRKGTVKGEAYTYWGKEAHCAVCGAEIYVDEVNDFNLRALYDLYREKNGIVSLETVLAIPEKYDIGKRPLSLLLGWGELTFSRYCDGDMPTKQYSDTLRRIYNEPSYYAEILEKNKGSLKPVAYEKSKKAVHALLGSAVGRKTKIDLVIEYMLSQCQDITPLALQKSLYYVQGFYYAFFENFLFSEDCEAWVHGPVYRDIYYRYRNYRFDCIEAEQVFDDSVFTSAEKAILDSVAKYICCYSGKVLERFTHLEPPWLKTRGELLEDAVSNRIIQKEEIGRFFFQVKGKYHMITPNDIREYAKSMFEQI